MAELTPMMQQYMEVKNEYQDCILFYRLGDFYEMFYDDALTASRVLEITLTGRNCGQEERAPMCGVPYHSCEGYITRLLAAGYKVAICEQVEEATAGKGLVRREVTRVVTPGTNLNTQVLDETKHNYIMCITYIGGKYGVSAADVSTGTFVMTEIASGRKLVDEVNRFAPSEIICNEPFLMSGVDLEEVKHRLNIVMYSLDSWYFDEENCEKVLKEHFGIASLEGLGISRSRNESYDTGVIASGALMQYLLGTQKNALRHITTLKPYTSSRFMMIDNSTRRNLELVETLREKQKRGTLLWVLDKTKTAMGARMLRSQVEQPLVEKDRINDWLDALTELNAEMITREEIREYLQPIYDLERLLGRVAYQSANPRDLISFRNSIEMLPHIKNLLKPLKSPLLKEICEQIDPLTDLFEVIDAAIVADPPLAMKEGGIIRDGYYEDLDKLRAARTEGKNWLADLEAEEREKTGIKNLK